MKDHHQGRESQPVAENRLAEKPKAIISGQSQAEGMANFSCAVTYEDLTPERRERLKLSILTLRHRESDPWPQRGGAPCRPPSRDETVGGEAQGLARDQADRRLGEEHHCHGDPLWLVPLGRPGALPRRWPYRDGYQQRAGGA
jgi:hypothetical protein